MNRRASASSCSRSVRGGLPPCMSRNKTTKTTAAKTGQTLLPSGCLARSASTALHIRPKTNRARNEKQPKTANGTRIVNMGEYLRGDVELGDVAIDLVQCIRQILATSPNSTSPLRY